jgi:Carbohydrate phosphorylase
MAEEAGVEKFFLFGLTAEQVAQSQAWYDPHWHYEHEPETRAALDLIFADHFSRNEPGVFARLRDTLLTNGDYYMHLADLQSYLEADQRLVELFADPGAWARKAILNVAASGRFSSDRTIWSRARCRNKIKHCPGKGLHHDDFPPCEQAGSQGDVRSSGPARTGVFRAPARLGRPQSTGQLRHQRTPGGYSDYRPTP